MSGMTIIRAAECITNKMLASTCKETEYSDDVCHSTNGAHIEFYWTWKKLCEVQCLKMYQFLHYTLQLKICTQHFILLSL